MLSTDLESFNAALLAKKTASGEIILDSRLATLAELALEDCIKRAREMEAAGICRPTTVIDLTDDKIVLFPVVKRPVPINDGGAA